MTDPTRNYLLIGAGGTGSILFNPLLRYLESIERTENKPFTLAVIDGKAIRPNNLDRQMFMRDQIDRNKAEALIEAYRADPRVVIAVPRYLGKDDMTMIAENDIVLIAADNWPIRRHIEEQAKTLKNITIINGGNELRDGSMQIMMRRKGKDIMPPLSKGHPEILADDGQDMALLDCHQIAELPGGEQTIMANMMSAVAMLNAVHHVHRWEADPKSLPKWNEVFFDLQTFAMRPDTR